MASATNDLKVVVLGVLITPAQQATLEQAWEATTGVDPGRPDAEQTTTDLVAWLLQRGLAGIDPRTVAGKVVPTLEVRGLGDTLEVAEEVAPCERPHLAEEPF